MKNKYFLGKKQYYKKIVNKLTDTKFITIVIGVTAAICIIFTFIYIFIAQSAMKRSYLESTSTAMCSVGENISNVLVSAEMISETVFVNDVVQDALKETGERKNHLSEYRTLTNLLESAEYNRNIRISLYVEDDKIYSEDRVHFYPISDAEDKPWSEKVTAENGRGVWVCGETCRMGAHNEEIPVISFIRLIKSRSDFRESIGIIRVDVPVFELSDFMDSIVLEDGNNVMLIDSEGKTVINSNGDTGEAMFTPEEMKNFVGDSGVFERKHDKQTKSVIYCSLSESEWYIVADIPNKDVRSYKTLVYTVSVFSVTFTMLVVFSILLACLVYSRFVKRKIQELTVKIDVENIEEMHERKSERKGDIFVLEDRINDAIYHIGKITRAYYDSKFREEKALMTALQAQINPHFLYNTLDAINWAAIKNNDHEISSMVSMLARYFRLSLGMGKNIVTINDEIELVKVYISIQQFRFQNRIDVRYNIAPELFCYLIPKMTMQPIIENAIIHGICKDHVANGRLEVSVTKIEDKIRISIIDNGGGTDEKKLNESILSGNKKTGDKCVKSGYGLNNVYERIMLFSDNDEDCGMTGRSSELGTEIIIILKAKTEID